jgi:hypothetical protein
MPDLTSSSALPDSCDEHAQPMPFHSSADEPSRPNRFGSTQ